MLVRHQILLDNWMADFLKQRARQFGISFSESIRKILCLHHIMLADAECGECRSDMSMEKYIEMTKKWGNSVDKKSKQEMRKALSDIYFDARKAIECFNETEEKGKCCKKAE